MLKIRKYLALGLVFLPLFLFRFIAANFVIEKGNEIYSYVPAEADVLVEVNTRNFIKEIAYQRIFNEAYFLRKVAPSEGDQLEIKQTGINYFDRIVVFRESWSTEKVWALVLAYTDEEAMRIFAEENFPGHSIYFGSTGYAIIQISSSENQEAVSEHLLALSKKEVKPITEKIDIRAAFERDKEINCYFAPQAGNAKNQIIDGFLSFDFVGDEITLSGNFNPVSDFNSNATIAYEIDEELAFSMRSSLNLFHSIYWFSNERIEDLPIYSQLALDYDGVNMLLCDDKKGTQLPYKSYPDMQLRLDIKDGAIWKGYFNELTSTYKIDTTTKMMITDQGAYFKYNLTDNVFELKRHELNFKPSSNDSLYVKIHLNSDRLFENTIFAIDEDNPASKLEQQIGLSIANELVEELHELTVISHFDFYLAKRGETLSANGRIEMKEKGGQSMIECLFLGSGALTMLQEY